MRLIVTGHDLAGKSSVLNKLFESHRDDGTSFMHLSYKDPTEFAFYEQTLAFNKFIMDRCFVDELIYPKVFNRTGNLSLDEAQTLFDMLEYLNIKLFIFECSDDEIKRRIELNNGREEAEVEKNVFKIKEMYRTVAKKYGLTIIDTTGKTVDEIITEMGY